MPLFLNVGPSRDVILEQTGFEHGGLGIEVYGKLWTTSL